ncbi:MAG: hypothetical protein COA70_01320 [Planctomycetota bacterium]|nr:MAG: hypothetical protein COA70_01320 [Planctomycetota bacterium]
MLLLEARFRTRVNFVISTLLILIPLALPAGTFSPDSSSPEAGQQQSRPTYILAGQSNMDGLGLQQPDGTSAYAVSQNNLSSLGYAHYLPKLPEVQIFRGKVSDGTGKWSPLDANWGTEITGEATRFGPELAFGQQRFAMTQEGLRLIKYSFRNTNLADNWNPSTPNGYYSRLLDTVSFAQRAAANNSEALDIQGFLWMQGEADAGDMADASNYEVNLENFIRSVRTDLNLPHLKFYLGSIGNNANLSYYTDVRNAQIQVARRDRLVFLVDGASLSTFSNDGVGMPGVADIHYDTQGQLDLGHRFADAIESVLFVSPTAPIAGVSFRAFVEKGLALTPIRIMYSKVGVTRNWNMVLGIYEGISQPMLIGSQTIADRAGNQNWKLSFPPSYVGVTVWLQAWQVGHTSQVLQLQL